MKDIFAKTPGEGHAIRNGSFTVGIIRASPLYHK
jgi:hypothetical protein